MADVKTKQFWGTEQTLMGTQTDITAGNFSAAGATLFDNTNDGSVPYATHGLAVLTFAMVSTVTNYAQIELWGVLQNTDGTADDTDPPATTAQNGAKFLGSFTISSGTNSQTRSTVISLEGVKGFEAYLKNGSAVSIDSSATLDLRVTPFTYGVTTA